MLPVLGEQVFPVWIVGFLIGGSAFLQLIADVPAGFILDRFGYARMLGVTATFLGLGGCVLLFGLHPWTYLFLILFSAAGWLFFESGVNAYILSYAPPRHAGQYIGVREVIGSLGLVLSTPIFSLMLDLPARTLGVLLIVVLFSAAGITFFLRRTPIAVPTEKKLETHHYYVRRQYLHQVMKATRQLNPVSSMLALSLLSSSLFYGIIWFTVPLAVSQEMQHGMLDSGLFVFDLAAIIFGGIFGRLADRYSKSALIFFGLLLFAVASMFLGFNVGIWFMILGFFATTGDELSSISLWTWLNHVDKDHAHDGLIAGVMTFFEDVGWTIGPILAGLLYTLVGPSWTIAAGSVFVFLTWGFSSFMMRKTMPLFVLKRIPISSMPYRAKHKT